MASFNRIILVGKLTADPENRFTVEGKSMSKFNLAVDRPARIASQSDAGGPGKEGQPIGTDFIDIVAWERLSEIASQHLTKEQIVLVEGRIQVRSFLDEGGTRKWATEVIARHLKMLSPGKGAKPKAEVPAANNAEEPEPSDDFEASGDLPF